MNTFDNQVIYEKINNFIDDAWKFDLNGFLDFLSTIQNNDKLIKNYLNKYFSYLVNNYDFYTSKEIFNFLKDNLVSKDIIEYLTKAELQFLFDYWNKDLFKNKDIQKYVLNLVNSLDWTTREYWLAIKKYFMDNNVKEYHRLIKQLAYTWFPQAIDEYKNFLVEQVWKVSKQQKLKKQEEEIKKFALYIKDYEFLWDFYYDFENYEKAIEYYKLWFVDWDIETAFSIIDSYIELNKKWNSHREHINYYIELLSKQKDTDKVFDLKLETVKWDVSLYFDEKDVAFEFYYSAYKKALQLREEAYIEKIWYIIFSNFYDKLKKEEVELLVQEVQNANPRGNIAIEYYNKIENFQAVLALSILLFESWINTQLYDFLDQQIKRTIKKLSYKDLFSIVDIKSIEKEYPWIFLTEEVLRWVLESSYKYIDEERLSNKYNDLVNKDKFLSDLVVKVVEEESSDLDIKLEDDEEKILEELWLYLSPNFLEDIEKVNKEILDKLETINDLITLLELKERVNGYYESEKEVNIYDIFSLFTLLEPKTHNVKDIWDYLSELYSLYLLNMPYINLWFYWFLKNIYLNWLQENTETEFEIKWNIEFVFRELEFNRDVKENAYFPKYILNTFSKIINYQHLDDDDMSNIELILSFDLKDNEYWYKIKDVFVTWKTWFVYTWDKIQAVNTIDKDKVKIDYDIWYKKHLD